MRLSVFAAIVMIVVVTTKRLDVAHADLSSILSEYTGSAMLNQASGGLLGSNQSLLSMVGSKLTGQQP
jgi:hypothetical protein